MFCTTSVLEKCLRFTKPSCWSYSCLTGDTFPKPKSCKTLFLTTKAFSHGALLLPHDILTFLRLWVIRQGTSVCSQLSICHLPFQIPPLHCSDDEFLSKTFWCRIKKKCKLLEVSFESILCRQKTRAAKGIRKFLPQHNSTLKLFFTSFWQKCVCFSFYHHHARLLGTSTYCAAQILSEVVYLHNPYIAF